MSQALRAELDSALGRAEAAEERLRPCERADTPCFGTDTPCFGTLGYQTTMATEVELEAKMQEIAGRKTWPSALSLLACGQQREDRIEQKRFASLFLYCKRR